MKGTRLLVILGLLVSLSTTAQTVVLNRPQTLNIEGFKGAEAIVTLAFSSSVNMPTVADTVFNIDRKPVEAKYQPVINTQGQYVLVRFPNTRLYPTNTTHQLRIGPKITQAGYVLFDYRTDRPSSQTLTYALDNSSSPVSVTLVAGIGGGGIGGNTIINGLTTKIYPVSNVANSGYIITHAQNNSLVTSECYRLDTGQIDPLWRVIINNANTIQVKGPPGETFTGTVVLHFSTQTN